MMSRIGIHFSHELYPPGRLLQFARIAERAGFRQGMCSDHFHPWVPSQGQSGFAWSWLGAVLQGTQMMFCVITAPGQRYHPAILAQAAGTLLEMFPNRLWICAGSGEALNESITGHLWPSKSERNQRLDESVQVMRQLWSGQTVNHDGLVRVRDATLYTRPSTPPRVFAAALTEETAHWAGSWADGLVTTCGSSEDLRRRIGAFRDVAGDKPVYVQSAISFGMSDSAAIEAATRNWPLFGISQSQLSDLPTPQDFQRHLRPPTEKEQSSMFRSSASIQQHIDWIHSDLDAGAARTYLHYLGPDMETFLETFGALVLPKFEKWAVK